MHTISNINGLIRWRNNLPPRIKLGLVPTMGALHRGHRVLIERSLHENKRTIVSIFLNPKQFRPGEDFSRYPRQWVKDRRFLSRLNIQILFAPHLNSMYPFGYATKVSVSGLSTKLCGSPLYRGPQHFEGVATVVAKLFSLVQPTRAYFGMKDFQQLRVIEQMNKDLNQGVKIVRCPTVREKDGLAYSSRNANLSIQDRVEAPRLYSALQYGRKLLRSKPKMSLNAVLRQVSSRLKSIPRSRLDYCSLVDPNNLENLRQKKSSMLLAAALRFRGVRLIDNILVSRS